MPTAPQPLRARKSGWPAAPPHRVPVEYPESDGKPMAETEFHLRLMYDVLTSLWDRYGSRADVYVGGNLMMYYVENSPKISVSPDVFVAFGPSREPRRRVWKTWEEGKFADFVLEVTSESTRGEDERRKRDVYRRLGVTEYWQFDPTGDYLNPRLKGRRLNARRAYRPIPLTTEVDGALRGESKVLALHLCLDSEGCLRLYDPATGEFLPTPKEHAHASAAKDRIIVEERRASAAKDRIIVEERRTSAAKDRIIVEERRTSAEKDRIIEELKRRLADR